MKANRKYFLIAIITIAVGVWFGNLTALAQTPDFDHQDTIRGSITPERAWWDLTYYHLSVKPNPADSSLSGNVIIQYTVLTPNQKMQIDLQEPMLIDRALQSGEELTFERLGNVFYLSLKETQQAGDKNEVQIFYHGKPKVSLRPPWDGGIAWKSDSKGNPFVATACQGEGASLWWPCKDHMYDEPDSMRISITVPKGLTGVANGRLEKTIKNKNDKTETFQWVVKNPINNYGVNMNVGAYVSYTEVYDGENGPLDCSYYVLSEDLDSAKEHFKQVPMMLEAFEYWFGPYPFYEDSYKLVQVPYPGMEHQSSVTYGNGFKNGFYSMDLSNTGWGSKWDFIIVHESAHEWFANSITYRDIADMWIHESFAAYSESLFTEYYYGIDAGADYVRGTRANINNDRPIIGLYDVNYEGSGDMYPKGANMLHTLRQIVNNDSIWVALLRGLNMEFYHQTVNTAQVENYMAEFLGLELRNFFDQYLRDKRIPVFEYTLHGHVLRYRWNNCIDTFNMPLKVDIDGEEIWLEPTTNWKMKVLDKQGTNLKVDPNFYVAEVNLQGSSKFGPVE
ncbi:MAG: M1 family metallopeptidase [Bacteroidales bacterium]|nr:M1 family metallopeptidase [Bacteroidales bacterium]